jgi:HD-like signal output (HDOD) protein
MSALKLFNGIDVTPPVSILARAKKRGSRLLMLKDVAAKALKIGRDPYCSIEDFTNVVSQDVKLASDVLKIANSVLYSPRTPIIDLRRAIVRLGFNECQNLILTSSIASMVYKLATEQEMLRTVLWWHSVNTGLLATYINRSFQLGFQGEEFTAGIIHDIGRTLFAVFCPDEFNKIDPMTFDESPETLKHEMSVIETDHCRMGTWFALQNELPKTLHEVIYRHHRPDLASSENRKLTALTAVADHMANYMQRTRSCEGYDTTTNPALPILASYVPAPFETHFAEVAVSLMQEAHNDAKTFIEL